MMMIRILLALLILASSAGGEEMPLPNPPSGQVLDQARWLDRESGEELEAELARLRHTHRVDVLVVIWNQTFGTEEEFQKLAQVLGDTWSREDLWAVVLHHPDSATPPLVAWGGLVIESIKSAPLTQAVDEAIARGLKEWSARDRVSNIALNLGEELVFLQQRQGIERKVAEQQQAAALATASKQVHSRIIRLSLFLLGTLVALALAVAAWLHRRSRPTSFQFPQTRWRRRLGGNWSGGGSLTTPFTTPPGND